MKIDLLLITALPYLFSLLLVTTRVSSIILERRNNSLSSTERDVAKKWSSIADLITVPLTTLCFAVTRTITWQMQGHTFDAYHFAVGAVAFFIFIALMFLGAFYALATDIRKERKRDNIIFFSLKSLSILMCAVIDISLNLKIT